MADDDDFGMGDIEDPEGYAVASAAGELSTIAAGGKVLKLVALLSGVLWAIAVVTIFWNWYDLVQTAGLSISLTAGSTGNYNTSLVQAVANTLSTTWGYALVAVVAYLGSMLLHGQRMRLLIAAMGDD